MGFDANDFPESMPWEREYGDVIEAIYKSECLGGLLQHSTTKVILFDTEKIKNTKYTNIVSFMKFPRDKNEFDTIDMIHLFFQKRFVHGKSRDWKTKVTKDMLLTLVSAWASFVEAWNNDRDSWIRKFEKQVGKFLLVNLKGASCWLHGVSVRLKSKCMVPNNDFVTCPMCIESTPKMQFVDCANDTHRTLKAAINNFNIVISKSAKASQTPLFLTAIQATKEADPAQETKEADPTQETKEADPTQETKEADPTQETKEATQEIEEADPTQEILTTDSQYANHTDPNEDTTQAEFKRDQSSTANLHLWKTLLASPKLPLAYQKIRETYLDLEEQACRKFYETWEKCNDVGDKLNDCESAWLKNRDLIQEKINLSRTTKSYRDAKRLRIAQQLQIESLEEENLRLMECLHKSQKRYKTSATSEDSSQDSSHDEYPKFV